MTTSDRGAGRGVRRSPEKRKAIADAARAVFVREGFARASVDTIAAEAGVSKRTIYNHYGDKKQLFLAIVEQSTDATATSLLDVARRRLAEFDDVEEALIAFGREWVRPDPRFTDHVALVRLIIAEAAHHPEIVRAWHDAGPRQVRNGLARQLKEIAERGMLEIDDPEVAARHFGALVHSPVRERSLYGALELDEADVDAVVRDGVRAFLRIYRGPGGRP
ncbi:TetR/AcrR family transcriptional regulator [Saccharomonospora saliphila]|uniref:TetR/AcrR family transcriptional regulator n=1 Tax=Saccharomonospora saliphila TaxID=369829 RepID=UPI0006629893|nr:TetR/AcrR family transcriptional regulator [Saccharomonospora saliphila]